MICLSSLLPRLVCGGTAIVFYGPYCEWFNHSSQKQIRKPLPRIRTFAWLVWKSFCFLRRHGMGELQTYWLTIDLVYTKLLPVYHTCTVLQGRKVVQGETYNLNKCILCTICVPNDMLITGKCHRLHGAHKLWSPIELMSTTWSTTSMSK